MTTATSVIRRLATLTAALLLVCAWSTRTRAAVALDAVTTNVGTGTSVTIPHTTGIAADRVMLVGVSLYNSSKAVTSCTYGGTALTRLGFLDGGSGSNDRRVEMWMLVNPPAGTNNVVVSFASSAKAVVGVATLFGVDQTTPSGPFVSNEANTNVATLTVPSAAGEMVIDCMSVAGNAATATVGPGQTSLWNDFSRNNGGAVVGTASAEAGAPSVAMTWNLSAVEYWVLGAVSLKPAIRPYQPDLMVKLSGEANTAYFYNYFYENPAVLQVKAASVLAASTASYNVRIENDGLSPDRFLLAGTAPTSAFAVQYLDETGTDRTAAVAGGGYTTALLAPGAGVVWTLNVTPQPAGNAGGLTFAASLTGTSQGDGTKSDQVLTQTTCVSPNLVMSKSVDLANALPGQDIHYTMVANSTGLSDASGIVLVDSIPAYAGFQIGSATFNSGTTSLTSSVSYSNDHGLTWGYTPGTGSCTAPSGYDYCVTHVRWTLAGTMPPSQNFTVGMTVRVK
ncbi:MAG TPA: hypothetical protein VFH88_11425 [Candidatus Krumholzibacteria bacterium]|nr:hypothetical protein [Candidatus Krumholzibacteria bacterium]